MSESDQNEAAEPTPAKDDPPVAASGEPPEPHAGEGSLAEGVGSDEAKRLVPRAVGADPLAELKAWVRRELLLVATGHDEQERRGLNP